PTTGRIYFPLLEPFGSDLAERITDPELADFYSYQQLYDSTIFQAREFPEKNRFAIRGSYKSSVQSEISLGAFNIPFGSERVTAGGAVLVRDRDYTIDYNTGRIRILNDAILSSGVPIDVSFEDNTIFSLQSKTMIGLRADYEVSDNLALGATFLQLFERPFTQKVNIGEDPINNRIYGLDLTFNTESNWLTRAVDKLPLYSTSVPSNISFVAETALLRPGHSRAINQSRTERGGIVYLDDFEGSANPIDLMTPVNNWFLASVPQNDAGNNNPLFPESSEAGVVSGANRALLNWYRIDPQAREGSDNNNFYTNRVPQAEVFPNLNIPVQQQQRFPFFTFDLSFDPQARGPYNYDVPDGIPGFTRGVDLVNNPIKPVELIDPETRWGGIMREMTTNDFQSANIEFVEFWMLSPFLDPENPRISAGDAEQKQGTLYLNFGNVSEDILKDSRYSFENGLPSPGNPTRPVDETVWGQVPVTQQINRGFDNTTDTRDSQDVGLDGIDDEQEQEKFADYLNALAANDPVLVDIVRQDPANDNFRFFNDPNYETGTPLLDRYSQWNNTEGNSANNRDLNRRQSSTNLPDGEDLNRDNTLNESETYFQYEIPLVQNPTDAREFDLQNTPYITDRLEADNGRVWYRFRVPLNDPGRKSIGGIQDFRSIRFMRMYMRGFETQTVLRFARFELVRNSWRRYNRQFTEEPPSLGETRTEFSVDAVNIEENSQRAPFAYSLPVGIRREQSLGVVNTLQNEQSLALRIDNLKPQNRRAVFKYTEADLRLYERLKMFVHAEGRGDALTQPEDGELSLFIRFGSDFESNYYEYEVPLDISDTAAIAGLNVNTDEYRDEVWRAANDLDLELSLLRRLKQERNDLGIPLTDLYSTEYRPTDSVLHTVSLRGNPNLGFVKVFMIGVKGAEDLNGGERSIEVWANELRLEGLDERGGVAAVARADIQLADLGTVTAAVNYNSIGFGALDNSVQERSREKTFGYDFAGQFNLDKFFPEQWGLRLPLYVQQSRTVSTPEYDPYDFDIVLQEKLDRADPADRDSLREQTQDITQISAINLTDVGVNPQNGGQGNPAPWDIQNFSLSVGQTRTQRSDPFIAAEDTRETTAALDYGFSRGRPTYIEPFKNIESRYLRWLKEFNFNPLPNSFGVTNVLNRLQQTTEYRFDETESV
ncbi:MAG: cell surface protein SprA, partial [Bacteroidota bacterium]